MKTPSAFVSQPSYPSSGMAPAGSTADGPGHALLRAGNTALVLVSP